jgi:hypothetical protein
MADAFVGVAGSLSALYALVNGVEGPLAKNRHRTAWRPPTTAEDILTRWGPCRSTSGIRPMATPGGAPSPES